ncbi:MAG: hypothetical protein EOP07_16195 [Proteobacteria bacterium]|nr:MAG: hypothetical protein EOP07_16195 [Pseudomonadota bacterium]
MLWQVWYSNSNRKQLAWKRGDSLTSALFSLGIGHNKSGARIYGRKGWLQRNISYYERKNWDGIEEGSTVKLIVPKALSPEIRTAVQEEAVVETSPVETPTVDAPPVETPIVETPLPAETALPKEEAPTSLDEVKAPLPPIVKPKAKAPLKKPQVASESLKFAREHQLALGFFILMIGLSIYSYRQKTVQNLELRMSAVANSFLSWMVLGGSHQGEHIVMAETLFVGPTSDRALNAYQLMGFFAKDLAMMAVLDERLRLENTLPAIDYSLDPMQDEFLGRFLNVSPTVYFRIIAFSTSPFLQIAGLKVLKHHFLLNADFEAAPQLGKELVAACSKYPNLRKNAAVRKQILETIASFDSAMNVPKVG